ncbi:exosortase F system-associated membrane protein [Fulvivirga ligni]|uniref:exosortase F system-associated membrane protein n=1 Tax=Fulvivirga ligni TaxID=2904246 RepID=UPI001F328A51|nr:exosortase F system-associated protein [Fulvivirga ligni]UII23892.1 exosortase F system-associated protein [Fulvivirga ligni]
MLKNKSIHWGVLIIAIIGLMIMYLVQRNIQAFFNSLLSDSYYAFVAARIFRFLINDLLMIAVIYALFKKRKYVVFAFYVQLAGIIFILTPYLIIKSYTSYNGPLLSYLHRLIVNPLLMLLLIPAFLYQEKINQSKS